MPILVLLVSFFVLRGGVTQRAGFGRLPLAGRNRRIAAWQFWTLAGFVLRIPIVPGNIACLQEKILRILKLAAVRQTRHPQGVR
jgi:hypothetical protein